MNDRRKNERYVTANDIGESGALVIQNLENDGDSASPSTIFTKVKKVLGTECGMTMKVDDVLKVRFVCSYSFVLRTRYHS